jgi:hypothetical protein
MPPDGSSRLGFVLTVLFAAVPLYLLVTYQHCRGPGEGGTSALVGAAADCNPTGPIAIVRAPAATLVIATLVVVVCYVLASVVVFAFRR